MQVPGEREIVKIQWLLEQGGYPYSNRTKQHLKCKDHTCSIWRLSLLSVVFINLVSPNLVSPKIKGKRIITFIWFLNK